MGVEPNLESLSKIEQVCVICTKSWPMPATQSPETLPDLQPRNRGAQPGNRNAQKAYLETIKDKSETNQNESENESKRIGKRIKTNRKTNHMIMIIHYIYI
jgi:hypothetical protein